MDIYNSYAEAVIANGSTKGVCTTGEHWYGGFDYVGKFSFDKHDEKLLMGSNKWVECNPADHVESMVDFYARGLKLVEGDQYVNQFGEVVTVSKTLVTLANTPSEGDNKRFVLQAAADNEDTETPEEREVFEAMSESVNWQGSHTAFGNKYETGVTYYDRLNQCLCRLVGPVLDDGAACIVEKFDEDLTGAYLLAEWTALETSEQYEAGKKLRELWFNCQAEEVTISFDKIDSDIHNAWIELAKRVKVLDNA